MGPSAQKTPEPSQNRGHHEGYKSESLPDYHRAADERALHSLKQIQVQKESPQSKQPRQDCAKTPQLK